MTMKWYSAESLTHSCFHHPQFTMAECLIHQSPLQDFNSDGQRFVRPTCLECQGLRGGRARVIQAKPIPTKEPITVRLRRDLRRRLMRLAIKEKLAKQEDGLSLEELTKLLGSGPKETWGRLQAFEAKRKKHA